jgi:hypothetical protein
VNLRIDAVHIAGRALRLKLFRVEDKNPVFRARDARPVKGQTELDRHIEPGKAMGQLDARQIVNGEIRFFDSFNDRLEPALIRNRESGVDAQAGCVRPTM